MTVLRVASAFRDDGIIHEALGMCNLLIDSEEEAFLRDRAFARVLPTLIGTIKDAVPPIINNETESAVLEALFGIASKIRLEPDILPVWFRPTDHDTPNESAETGEQADRTKDFPLFYLLLAYVPSGGRAGEFARMGLLYIIEAASRSEKLETWIVEGDMATLMASGLGALYSQLSR